MKLIVPLFTLLVTLSFSSFSQFEKDSDLLYLGQTDFSIGSTNGIHPNFDNYGFGNYVNGHLEQKFRIKNIPLQFVGHLSNEEIRIGKPSYFRLSYDGLTARRLSKVDLGNLQLENKSEWFKNKELFHELEGKLSYKREMLRRLKLGQEIPDVNIQNPIASIDSLNLSGKIPDIQISDFQSPKLSKIDSLEFEIDQMLGDLSAAKNRLDSLELKMDQLNKMSLSTYVPEKFKLKKFSLGLTSLSSGGLSKNAIPIHGIHAEGTYKRTFYDLSAGLTQPFQNFSSQVFNQIISNTQNVFNLDQFFNASKMRLVTSSIVGYGNKYRSNIKVEHFYSGKSWDAIKDRTKEKTSNTLNVSGNYNNEKIKNLDIGFLVGMSLFANDSIQNKTDVNNLAYRGTAKYSIERFNGILESEYRHLGGEYDGYSQGILINGTTHKMIGYSQKIGRFSSISVRYMEDSFTETDSIVLFNSSKRWMSQGSTRINRNNKIQGSYSLIIGSGSEVNDRNGHLATINYINEIKIGKNRMTNIAQGGYTTIPVRISNQEIIHASLLSEFSTKKLTYSLKGSYEEYKGIEQLWGRNYILEPQIAYKGDKGEISTTYQFCKSEQFDTDHGLIIRANFTPSQFVTWQLQAQKWLAKERTFFLIQAPSFVAPWFVDIRLIIHLNVKK